eukprot:scaffold276655_cov36-Prasinocladus_malaysianus.AAC.1
MSDAASETFFAESESNDAFDKFQEVDAFCAVVLSLMHLCIVTDAKDRRALMTILEGFYCEKVLQVENATLSSSGKYVVPSHGDHKNKVDSCCLWLWLWTGGQCNGVMLDAGVKDVRAAANEILALVGNV